MQSHNTLWEDPVASLERVRQIIFNTNISEAEQQQRWAQHKARIEAYLAADTSPAHSFAHHGASLARTTAHVGLSTWLACGSNS